ncbi:ABC transporter substrate-binding protein [Comamonas serinivorans]|uniref:ABC transporter substrate-binding protein n=1 Tax=Comamonas serinivorans TaxID=1082851 RepID=A0A1Y0EPV0_9BURK|nr:tripartite tricarboxylate transporter substrate-binding protein [Comamonas serinivorans]ARU05606.1 ABC transporter substrate-binding protein [Comamonas serinivorans]
MQRRHFLGGLASVGLATAAHAGPYPDRSVRLICPYAAGGGPDLLCRELAPLLGGALKQSVYVENKVGAGGVLAAQYLVGQPADGYTLMLATNAHLIQKLLQPKLRFALGDFAPVGLLSTSCAVLMVAKSSPWQTVADLVNAARREPGKLNFGSGGIGTPAHIAGETLGVLGGMKAVHVPLTGSVEIPLSLMRGDTQFAFPNLGTAQQALKTGKLRALAVTSAKRVAVLPEVPTLVEALKSDQAVLEAWSGIWVHAKTPPDIVARLHTALNHAAVQPRMAEYARLTGSDLATSPSPQDFTRFVQTENTKMAEIIALSQAHTS